MKNKLTKELFFAMKSIYAMHNHIFQSNRYSRHERRLSFAIMTRCVEAQVYLNKRAMREGERIATYAGVN